MWASTARTDSSAWGPLLISFIYPFPNICIFLYEALAFEEKEEDEEKKKRGAQ